MMIIIMYLTSTTTAARIIFGCLFYCLSWSTENKIKFK
uniref:Uncharacterized protein n=1 Tax=Anguilla anguilla TaxID=7936 RepID=A0A0E9QT23_ANGAN